MSLSHSPSIVTNGLLLYVDPANVKSYPGTDTALYDVSGNENHGTLVNGVSFNTSEVGTKSFVFDGVDDYITCGNNSTLNGLNNEVTVEICCSVNTATAAYSGIITKLTSGSYEGWAIQYVSQASNVITCRWFGGANNNNSVNFNINQNETTHILCTVDSSKLMKVYLNGNFVAQNQALTFNTNSTEPLTIGKLAYFNNYVDCKVYAAKVYNRALTEQEIKQNFNAIRGRFGL